MQSSMHLIHNKINILTIENPVEYHIEGITQFSVKPEQGLGFADTLRAAQREDPDVLLIGEITDEETANIAVKAAFTGHLVLSILHSSDVVTAIQRLLNLGIAPDLLSETLTVIVSKRLVRRLCSHQKEKQIKSTYFVQKLLEVQGYGLLRPHSRLRNSEGEFSGTGPDSDW